MPTLAAVETVLTRRLGSLLDEAGLSVEAGPNPHLADPVAWALRALGYSVASIVDVSDSDLAPLATGHVDALLDLAELRTLEAVAGNMTAVDVTVGPVSERRGSLGDRVVKLVESRREAAQARWGGLLVQPLQDSGGPVRLVSL